MPVLQGNQNTTLTPQLLANQLKPNPEFYQILGGQAGYATEPMLTICNEIMSRILAENMPWKWNRYVVPPFITASLQQDYITNITNFGWLENAWLIDINNSTSNASQAPKPIRPMNVVRDIPWTSCQSVPYDICFIPNTQVSYGIWEPQTFIGSGYGVAQLPTTPIQQFIDGNGNILFIDSTKLGLNIESPGYTGTTITPPGFSPYGTTGTVAPLAPPNATPGTLVTDGTVTWTVGDPNGYALRVDPLPALNGLCWLVVVQAQAAPPDIPTLQTRLNPIPTQYMYLFRQGVRARLKMENGAKDAAQAYADWEETLVKAVRGADRQQEEYGVIPIGSMMGWGDSYGTNSWAGIGAANPFGSALWGPFGT